MKASLCLADKAMVADLFPLLKFSPVKKFEKEVELDYRKDEYREDL